MKGNLKMKKLNNKGFTLIELLAVIVILAIVVAITIPAVLSSINSARTSAFETTAKTVADWAEREYQAYLVNKESIQKVDQSFKDACAGLNLDGSGGTCGGLTDTGKRDKFLTAAGVDPKNYSNVSVVIKDNGRACVKLYASSTGDYKNESGNNDDGTPKYVQSPGCP